MLHYKSQGTLVTPVGGHFPLGMVAWVMQMFLAKTLQTVSVLWLINGKLRYQGVIVVVQLEWMITKMALRCHVKGRRGADK
jgi:hypothetical protein